MHTCFPLSPAYRINDKILCTRLILENLNLRSIATHFPMTGFRFGLGFRVCVHACRMVRRTGAFICNSLRGFSHVNSCRSSMDWLLKIELALSEHRETSSFRTIIPFLARIYFLVAGSFKRSTPTDCLFFRAPAFTICLRLSVVHMNLHVKSTMICKQIFVSITADCKDLPQHLETLTNKDRRWRTSFGSWSRNAARCNSFTRCSHMRSARST